MKRSLTWRRIHHANTQTHDYTTRHNHMHAITCNHQSIEVKNELIGNQLWVSDGRYSPVRHQLCCMEAVSGDRRRRGSFKPLEDGWFFIGVSVWIHDRIRHQLPGYSTTHGARWVHDSFEFFPFRTFSMFCVVLGVFCVFCVFLCFQKWPPPPHLILNLPLKHHTRNGNPSASSAWSAPSGLTSRKHYSDVIVNYKRRWRLRGWITRSLDFFLAC